MAKKQQPQVSKTVETISVVLSIIVLFAVVALFVSGVVKLIQLITGA